MDPVGGFDPGDPFVSHRGKTLSGEESRFATEAGGW